MIVNSSQVSKHLLIGLLFISSSMYGMQQQYVRPTNGSQNSGTFERLKKASQNVATGVMQTLHDHAVPCVGLTYLYAFHREVLRDNMRDVGSIALLPLASLLINIYCGPTILKELEALHNSKASKPSLVPMIWNIPLAYKTCNECDRILNGEFQKANPVLLLCRYQSLVQGLTKQCLGGSSRIYNFALPTAIITGGSYLYSLLKSEDQNKYKLILLGLSGGYIGGYEAYKWATTNKSAQPGPRSRV